MTRFDNTLCVGVEQSALTLGLLITKRIDFDRAPHLLIAAPSGSGKTYLLTYLLGQLAQKPGTLLLADFKGVDFLALDGCQHYYKHTAVERALQLTFDTMQERMADPQPDAEPIYFVIDEWAGFLSLHPKKEQEDFKQKMASILMLGRGVQVFVIMALQRADAAYITGRDNFGNCIGLGTLSRESMRMLFPDDADRIQPKPRGKGYLHIDGKGLSEIVVPQLRDRAATMQLIRKKVSNAGPQKE